MKYPKRIYVQVENEKTDDQFLNAIEKIEDILYDGQVAIYELKEIKEKKTKHLIE